MSKSMPDTGGTGNEIPKNEESVQTYARGTETDHPDEAAKEESPEDGEKLKPSVCEYPRGKED